MTPPSGSTSSPAAPPCPMAAAGPLTAAHGAKRYACGARGTLDLAARAGRHLRGAGGRGSASSDVKSGVPPPPRERRKDLERLKADRHGRRERAAARGDLSPTRPRARGGRSALRLQPRRRLPRDDRDLSRSLRSRRLRPSTPTTAPRIAGRRDRPSASARRANNKLDAVAIAAWTPPSVRETTVS